MKYWTAILLFPLLHGAVSANTAVPSECTETHTLPIITTNLVPGATLEPYAPGPNANPSNANPNYVAPPKGSAVPPTVPSGSGSGSGSAPGSNTTPISSDHPQYVSAASNPSAKALGVSAFVGVSIAIVLQMTNF